MEARNIFMVTRISITSVFLMAVALSLRSDGTTTLSRSSGQVARAESLVAEKVAARLAEDSFWGSSPLRKKELQLTLFLSADKSNTKGFDVLVVVPEAEETFEVRACDKEPIIVSAAGESRAGDSTGYLNSEIHRYNSFVAHARKTERLIAIETNPADLFPPESGFQEKRTAQIKLALGELLSKRPMEIRIAHFSRFTDQIDVLIPSLGDMYVMSVVHTSCDEETVEVGRRFIVKAVRPDLLVKIQQNSQVATIN
jgi:hypothetical protein